mgnify:CR=1 FL=1
MAISMAVTHWLAVWNASPNMISARTGSKSGDSVSDDIDRKKKHGKVTRGGSYEKRTAKRRRT